MKRILIPLSERGHRREKRMNRLGARRNELRGFVYPTNR